METIGTFPYLLKPSVARSSSNAPTAEGGAKQTSEQRQEAARPTSGALTAFGLSLAGVVIQAISAVAMGMFFLYYPHGTYFGGMMMYHGGTMMGNFPNMMGFGYSLYPWMMGVNVLVIAVAVALGVVGTSMLRSSNRSSVTTGSILVLVAAIIAYPSMWGFGIGSLLMFIGAIIGLTSAR